MSTEISAGCNAKHFNFAFHLPALSVTMARTLQNSGSGGA